MINLRGIYRKNLGRVVLICFIVALLASCNPAATDPIPTSFLTNTPTPTNTPVPSATPTPASPTIKFEKPTLWNVYDPKDPNLPELIVPGENGFRLDPQWQAVKIEYVYRMWTADEGGLASRSGLGHEIIKQNGSSYLWDDKRISAEQVNAFLSAITNLHPVQFLLVGVFHSDDYPRWQLELTGTDGNQILLYSASDENPGLGPWHVIYNGRIYAQYEGTLGPMIGNLFDGTDDSFIWGEANVNDTEYHPSDLVGFSTAGLPNQLSFGFTGLLPISSIFDYTANLANSEIQGYISNDYWLESKNINALNSVELTIDDKKDACNIKKPDDENTHSAKWAFSCRPESVMAGQRYSYPIQFEFGTNDDQKFITEGELYGVWQQQAASLVLPPGEEIQAAINRNPDLQNLLKDHIFSAAYYTGKIKLEKDKSPVLLGEIVLEGQATLSGYNFPYTITVPFGIIDQNFVEWGLTRQELQRFILDIFKSSLTLRIYKQFPKTTLNLWYVTQDKLDNFPAMPNFKGSIRSYFSIRLPECGKSPAIIFPQGQQPLRAFGFNSSVDFSNVTAFVLVDNKAVPYEMNLYPTFDKDELVPYLTPKELNVDGEIPFLRIYSDYSSRRPRDIELEAYVKDKDLANSIVASLPFSVATEFDYYSTVKDVEVVIEDNGSLSLVSCAAK